MALNKKIRQDDGVITSYHRILFVQITTNRQNSIAVVSYVDKDSRTDEDNGTITQPYKKSTTYETDYDEQMTIEKAYKYLKTLPKFKDSEDI